ncbi:hypothetical protein [Cohnella abietis]|uniref:Lipoprotein n=1 Tax=Cohnella abietis TaxID=2507935 RepID=A0A3T1D1X8_9BACL|nr:hypothetical protein [Cohnella abietis]BBI32117.1 hypothetical protein KCTCHS21_15160 [Cohnella abietis]
MKLRHNFIASVITLSVVLTGCGAKGVDQESPSPSASSTPAPTETSSAPPTENSGELILKQFQNQVAASLPANELFTAFKEGIEKVQPAQADELIRSLEAYYEKNLPDMEKKYEDNKAQKALMSLKWPITKEQIEALKDDSIRNLVEETLEGGYKLETAEGFIFPIVDYGQLLSYGDLASTAMKSYLDLMAMESDSTTASDGGLVISWDELSSRTLAAESYVVNFPDSPERNKAETQYINYLSLYLIGLSNTPTFDYDTFILLPEVKTQYEQMVKAHAGTVTGQLTKQFLDVLSKSGDALFVKNKNGEQSNIPAVKQFRDQIESAARSKLPAGKK